MILEHSKRPGAIEDWLCALDTESSRQSAKLLRGRTACVDITEDRWWFVSADSQLRHVENYGKPWKNWRNLEISPWKIEFWHDISCQSWRNTCVFRHLVKISCTWFIPSSSPYEVAENEVLTGHFWHHNIKSDRLKWGMGQRAKLCQSQVVPTKLGCYSHPNTDVFGSKLDLQPLPLLVHGRYETSLKYNFKL